jgi:cation:H+ antiporter
LLALDGRIGRIEGSFLFVGLLAYTLFLIRLSRRQSKAVGDEYARAFGAPARATAAQHAINLLFILGGLALLVLGSKWLVEGAIVIAQYFGVSQLVIGLTIVAVGTSLPEVATSILASIRGERDIAVGNVVGSNLFNLLGVLGLASAFSPVGIPVSSAALQFDLPIMVATAVACLPIFFTGHVIARWEGALFLGYYMAYATYLVLAATGNTALPLLRAAMVWFVIPLTLATLAVVTTRAIAAQRRTA